MFIVIHVGRLFNVRLKEGKCQSAHRLKTMCSYVSYEEVIYLTREIEDQH